MPYRGRKTSTHPAHNKSTQYERQQQAAASSSYAVPYLHQQQAQADTSSRGYHPSQADQQSYGYREQQPFHHGAQAYCDPQAYHQSQAYYQPQPYYQAQAYYQPQSYYHSQDYHQAQGYYQHNGQHCNDHYGQSSYAPSTTWGSRSQQPPVWQGDRHSGPSSAQNTNSGNQVRSLHTSTPRRKVKLFEHRLKMKGSGANSDPPAIRAAPRQSYLEQALTAPVRLTEEEANNRKLLVVLDLNETLVNRAKSKNGRATDSKRPRPRPYLSCFMEYCLGTGTVTETRCSRASQPHGTHLWRKENEDDSVYEPSTQGRAEVVIWSSAQSMNVNAMIKNSFDPELCGKVLRVWARDTLVKKQFYYSKTESVKDLEIVWAELNMWQNSKSSSGRIFADERDRKDRERPDDNPDAETISASLESALQAAGLGPWGPHNTVLVDDSADKARLQPHNQLVIPPFGEEAGALMKRYIQQNSVQTPGPEAPQSDDPAVTEAELDNVLLQTIGVLEVLRYQSNVSSFIYAGGIKGYGDAATNEPGRAEQDNTPEYWEKKGREACAKMGIEVKPWNPIGLTDAKAETVEVSNS